jgi:hypothetical protein
MATMWVCALLRPDHDLQIYFNDLRRQADVCEQAVLLGLKLEIDFDLPYADIGIVGSPDELSPLFHWLQHRSLHGASGFMIDIVQSEEAEMLALHEKYPEVFEFDVIERFL